MAFSHSILLPKSFAHCWDVRGNPRFEYSRVVMKKPNQEHCADWYLETAKRGRQCEVCEWFQHIVQLQQPQRAEPKKNETARKERNNICKSSHDPFRCLVLPNPFERCVESSLFFQFKFCF